MDRLKIIFADLKKHQFWVLCGAVLVVSPVCWWLATSGVVGQFQKWKAAIELSFSSAAIPPDPPNQPVITRVHELTDSLKLGAKGVFPAWETLYDQQKENNRLPDKLGPEFKREFEALKPGDELDSQYREIYQTYIKSHLPSLKELVDAMHPAAAGAAGSKAARADHPAAAGVPPGKGGSAHGPSHDPHTEGEWIGIVDWNEADYEKLEDRFKWDAVPSTLAVVLAQEDIWVYEAVLRAIKRTNEGATNQGNAAVKRIETLEIGAPAAEAWRTASAALNLGATAAGGAGAPGGMSDAKMSAAGMAGVEKGRPGGWAGGTSDEQIRQQLIQNRYVNDKGMPLDYDSSAPPLYADHPYAEFKIMPVCLRLVMDQKRLPRLLVECANSRMPIEVRRVRILTGAGSGSGFGTPAGGVGKSGGDPADAGGRAQPQESSQCDILVEIHAIIYIFNPPDREKLGKGAAAAAGGPAPAIPGGAPSTPPAGQPGMPPAGPPATPAKTPGR